MRFVLTARGLNLPPTPRLPRIDKADVASYLSGERLSLRGKGGF
jgi:hypothetical protein